MPRKLLFTVTDTAKSEYTNFKSNKSFQESKFKYLIESWIEEHHILGEFTETQVLRDRMSTKIKPNGKPAPSSASAVSKQLNELKSMGVIDESPKHGEGNVIYNCYTLKCITPILMQNLTPLKKKGLSGPYTKEREAIKEIFASMDDHSYMELGASNKALTLRLIQPALSSLPTKSNQTYSEILYNVGNKNTIKVQAQAVNGTLMQPKDNGVLSLLQGMLKEHHTDDRKVKDDYYIFDQVSLAKEIGLANRPDLAHEAMTRINNTVFTITLIRGDYFQNLFQIQDSSFKDNLDLQQTIKFQFFTEYSDEGFVPKSGVDLSHIDEKRLSHALKKTYKIKFHSIVTKSIEQYGRQSFVSHTHLKKIRSDYEHLIHCWCKARIGSSIVKDANRKKPLVFTMHDLKLQIHGAAPSTTYFQDKFLAVLRKYNGAELDFTKSKQYSVNVLGYVFKVTHNEQHYTELFKSKGYKKRMKTPLVIEISRDKHDKYVGDDAGQSQAIRRDAIALLESYNHQNEMDFEKQDTDISQTLGNNS